MDSLIQTLPQVGGYLPALQALTLLCLIVLAQGFLAGALGLGGGEEIAGMPLTGDHTKRSFRILRTYANSTENLAPMVGTAFLAILAGVSVAIVNWLVVLHVIFRVIYWAVYYEGVGKVTAGPRTMAYVAGFFMNFFLVIATLYTMVF